MTTVYLTSPKSLRSMAIVADEDAVMAYLLTHYDRSALSFDKLDHWLRDNTKRS